MELIFSGDPERMNWFRTDVEYGSAEYPEELSYEIQNRREGDVLYTECIFRNRTEKPYFTDKNSIRICFPLNDQYDGSQICRTNRCHAHIFCGGEVSYILGLRMGGEPPHFGMVLTEGSLECYSIQRDVKKMSNDRGIFWLHPGPAELGAGESFSLKWVIFPHSGREDFRKKRMEFPRFLETGAERYVLFQGETSEIWARPSFPAKSVRMNGMPAEKSEAGDYRMRISAKEIGEQRFEIEADGLRTRLCVLVQPPLRELAEKRCWFLAKHQQYQGPIGMLKGAYLPYDNEEGHMIYRPLYDYNGGRERAGMGMLMARYLRTAEKREDKLEESLAGYTDYVKRELVDPESGEVFNDAGRDASYERLYNMPWYASYFLELYGLWGREEDLELACRILRRFYAKGGERFYAIELPILELCGTLKTAGKEALYNEMKSLFCRHADRIAETGQDYPAHEVNYEQSIVAPAAAILLQAFLLTGEEKYKTAGEIQLKVLDLFQGCAPDYHLYETAIRHWDGFWFGKRRMYGDTFPHYWSGLTGRVFLLWAEISGKEKYRKRGEDCLRGVLSLFFPNGSAACAYLYPHSVNGRPGNYADPLANDQDWGLYYDLRYLV